MLADANSLEAVPASRSVREFIAVCARDNLPYGDLNCLPALLRELGANKQFAMHFWSAVAAMTEKQSADTEAVLAAIVEAVTGRTLADVREAGPAHRILLGRLERLLAGQDVEPEELAAAEPAAKAAAPAVSTPVTSQPVDDVLPIRRVSEKRRRGRRRAAAEDEPIAPITNPAWTRDESLRLVLMPEAPEPARVEPLVARTSEPSMRARLKPEPVAAEARAVPVPLSSYTETAPRRWVPAGVLVGALVLAVVGGGGYLILRNGGSETLGRLSTSVEAGYGSAVATWKNDPPQPTPAKVAPSAAAPAISPHITPQPAISQSPQLVTPAPTPVQQPGAQKARNSMPALTPAQNMAAMAAYNQQRAASESSGAAAGSNAGVVQVPEAAMNARLVTSRVPVVPEDVRARGITGVVRMQATINRNGFVSRLHVLQGPTELRHSALEAVSTWRYRPYLVDGQPVDVMTTVTVDFSSLD